MQDQSDRIVVRIVLRERIANRICRDELFLQVGTQVDVIVSDPDRFTLQGVKSAGREGVDKLQIFRAQSVNVSSIQQAFVERIVYLSSVQIVPVRILYRQFQYPVAVPVVGVCRLLFTWVLFIFARVRNEQIGYKFSHRIDN